MGKSTPGINVLTLRTQPSTMDSGGVATMSKQDYIHVRINPELKSAAEKVLGQTELSLSVAVNMFLRKVVNTGGIPFDVTNDQSILGSDYAQIERAAQDAVDASIARKRAKGLPVAMYDAESKRAYLEYPDGSKVFYD